MDLHTFLNKEEYSLDDIQHLIDNNYQEGLKLEFKSAGALDKDSAKIDKITASVSSLANSVGGVIIYGLSELNGAAHAFSFVDATKFSKDKLQQLLDFHINKTIHGIDIKVINSKENPLQQIYVVKVPLSRNRPHMASDKRYYRRTSSGKRLAEEFEVEEMYSIKRKPELQINQLLTSLYDYHPLHTTQFNNIGFHFKIEIANIGNVMEKDFKVQYSLNQKLWKHVQDFAYSDYETRTEGEKLIRTIKNKTPVFPSEILYLGEGYIKVNYELYSLFKDEELNVKLLFSSDIFERSFKIKDLFLYHGETVKRTLFLFQP